MTVGARLAAGDKITITYERMDDGRTGIISSSIHGERVNLPHGEVPVVYPFDGTQRVEVVDQNAALHGLNLVRAAMAYCDFMHMGWRGRGDPDSMATEMTVQARNLFRALRAAAGIPEPFAGA